MNHKQLIDFLVKARTQQLSEELDGDLNGIWDDDEQNIIVCGQCHKVHSDCRGAYPDGWHLMQCETIDEVLEVLGLEIQLHKVTKCEL